MNIERIDKVFNKCVERLYEIIEEEGYQEKAEGFEECLSMLVEYVYYGRESEYGE